MATCPGSTLEWSAGCPLTGDDPNLPSPAGVLSCPPAKLIDRTTQPTASPPTVSAPASVAYRCPPAKARPHSVSGDRRPHGATATLRAGPGPPTLPASVEIVPASGAARRGLAAAPGPARTEQGAATANTASNQAARGIR